VLAIGLLSLQTGCLIGFIAKDAQSPQLTLFEVVSPEPGELVTGDVQFEVYWEGEYVHDRMVVAVLHDEVEVAQGDDADEWVVWDPQGDARPLVVEVIGTVAGDVVSENESATEVVVFD
jgi:hypothetical protein